MATIQHHPVRASEQMGRFFVIRIVETNVDPFAGLKGHAYIKARNLNTPVRRLVQTSAQNPSHISLPTTGGLRAAIDAVLSEVQVRK